MRVFTFLIKLGLLAVGAAPAIASNEFSHRFPFTHQSLFR